MLGLKASPAFWREAYAALAFSAVLLNNGAAIGWSSPALPSLKEEEEWVREFDKDPYSEGWAGAVLCLTSCLGNVATPSLVAWLGPKLVLVTVCLPLFSLCWLGLVLARLAPSLALLLLARALSGVAVGVSISTVPSYIIAISSPRNQGLLALLPQFMTSLALLAVYLVGALVDWWWLSLSLLAMQPPLLLLLLLVPDSPSSLVARGKTAAARSALLWLRSPALEQSLQELQGVKSEQGDGLWLTLGKMGKPSNYRPMMASISLLSGLQLSGVSPLVFYSVKFFTLAGASTSPSVCSIIVASITLVTMVAVVMFGTKASRKNMLLISQVGLTACLFTLSGYFFADLYNSADSIRWLPLAILVLYFIFFNIGLSSYVWVITAEILPTDIRSQMVPLAILISSILWFFVTFFFQAMFEAMGGFYIFLFYSFCSLFFIFTTALFIPQTNGKSQEEIALFYSKYSLPCSTGP